MTDPTRRLSESNRVEAFSDGVFSIAIVEYALAALVGWLISPAIALGIFLVVPVLYVLRVRSLEH